MRSVKHILLVLLMIISATAVAATVPTLNSFNLANDTYITGTNTLAANITDIDNVASAKVNFNGTNYTMIQTGDVWSYSWNTSLNIDSSYNITLFYDDSLSNTGEKSFSNITIDNTNPSFGAYSISPYYPINTTMSLGFIASDTNVANVTCTVENTTILGYLNSGTSYKCNITSPVEQENYNVTITMNDKVGKSASIVANFSTVPTTTYTKTITPSLIEINNSLYNQSKIIYFNITLNNTGNGNLISSKINLQEVTDSASTTSNVLKSCPTYVAAGESCTLQFSATLKPGLAAKDAYHAVYTGNFTNNDNSLVIIPQGSIAIRVNNNEFAKTPKNITATIPHNTTQTLSYTYNNTGNVDSSLTITKGSGNASITLLNTSMQILQNTSHIIYFNVTIPVGTAPGLYTNTITSLNNVSLYITVPQDTTTTIVNNSKEEQYRKLTDTGTISTFTVTNKGNVDQVFNITYSGDFDDTLAWNASMNPTTLSVSKQSSQIITLVHKDTVINTINSLLTTTITSDKGVTLQKNLTLTLESTTPVLTISNPSNDTFVSGIKNINSTITDTISGANKLEIYLDNSLIKTVTSSPFDYAWNTSVATDGTHELKLIGYDKSQNIETKTLIIKVNNVDNIPTTTTIPKQSFLEETNKTINLSQYFENIDADSLIYTASNSTNITVTIIGNIATLTPGVDYFGESEINFTATDSTNKSVTSNNVMLQVNNTNDFPIAAVNAYPIDNANITNSQLITKLNWTKASDVDSDTLTYTVYLGTNTSNLIAQTPTTNNELIKSALTNNETYYWLVKTSDGTVTVNSSTTQFLIKQDVAPVLTATTPDSSTIGITENETKIFAVSASDDESNSSLTYKWEVDNITQPSTSATFIYTPTTTSAGTHLVKITAIDQNNNEVSYTWTLTVSDNNNAPTVKTSIPNATITEEETKIHETNINSYFEDVDTDNTLQYLIFQEDTSKVDCSIAGNQLIIVGVKDFSGSSTCSVVANDGFTNSNNNQFTITVSNVNDVPVITTSVVTVQQDQSKTENITAIDVETTSLFYSLGTIGNNITTSITNNQITVTPNTNYVGASWFVIQVSDGTNITTKNITVTVTDVNNAPAWTTVPEQNLTEEITKTLDLKIYASDPENNALTYTIMSENASKVDCQTSGSILTMIPQTNFYGRESCIVKVSDNSLEANKTIIMNVININDIPEITSFTPTDKTPIIAEDGILELSIVATDSENEQLTYKWYVGSTEVGTKSSYSYTGTGKEETVIVKAEVKDSETTIFETWTVKTTKRPVSSSLSMTNLQTLTDIELKNVEDFTLEDSSKGKIKFDNTVDVTSVLDIDEVVTITNNLIAVDSSNAPELNKPATLTLRNLNFKTTPLIYYNNQYKTNASEITQLCDATKCNNVFYGNGVLTFKVTGFSSYRIVGQEEAYSIDIPSSINLGTERNKNFTQSFSVINKGTEYLTNVNVSVSGSSNYKLGISENSNYQETITIPSIPAGTSVAVNIFGSIPESERGGSHSIGTVTVGNDKTQDSMTILINPDLKLEVTSVKAEVDDKTKTISAGETFDAEPGDKVEFKIKIKNTHTSDIDIEDVDVEMLIDDIDDGDEIEEDDSIDKIKSEDTETARISFTVPNDADEDDYKVEFIITGEDEEGVDHETLFIAYIQVEKPKHLVKLDDIYVASSVSQCNSFTPVDITVVNRGRSNEDDVTLRVTSSGLGLNIERNKIELDSEDRDDDEYFFHESIDLRTVTPGQYTILMEALYDGKKTDSETRTISISGCTVDTTSTTSRPSDSKESNKKIEVIYPIVTQSGVTNKSSDNGLLPIVMMLGIIFLVIVLVILVSVLLTRKKSKNRRNKKRQRPRNNDEPSEEYY